MPKSAIFVSGIFAGVVYSVLSTYILGIAGRIHPPDFIWEAAQIPNSWAVHLWRIVEWGPLIFIALPIGYGLYRLLGKAAFPASIVAGCLVALMLAKQVSSFSALLNIFAVIYTSLLPIVVYVMASYNKSLNTDASDAGTG